MSEDQAFAIRFMGRTLPVRRSTLNGVLIAAAVSVGLVFAAGKFRRPAPPSVSPPSGVKIGEHDVELAPGVPQWNVLKLGKVEPATSHWTEPIPARVRIDEQQAARIGAPLAGHVTTVAVELGQRVKKGDVLFSVASSDLAALRNDAAKAAVDLQVKNTQAARVHDMVEARLLPGKDELTADAEKRQAELEVHVAQSKINALKVGGRKDNEFTLQAPRDGVVVEKNVLPGQEITTDGTVIQIADVSKVWIVADVFEGDSAGVVEGAPVRITLPSLPGYKIETKVSSVSAVVDPTRHSIPVRVQVDNPDGKLRPNIYAEMRFRIELPPNTLEIPASSLVSDGATQFVWVEEQPGKLVRRKIVVGPARNDRVVILEGLKRDETVVIEGGILLDNQLALPH